MDDIFFLLLFGWNAIHAIIMLTEDGLSFDKEVIKRKNKQFWIWLGYCAIWSVESGLDNV